MRSSECMSLLPMTSLRIDLGAERALVELQRLEAVATVSWG